LEDRLEDEILTNSLWVHKETNSQYCVIQTFKQKNQTTREWEDSVLYFSSLGTFGRQKDDFLKRFVPLAKMNYQREETL